MNDKPKTAAPRWIASIAVAAVASILAAGTALAKPERDILPDTSRTSAVHDIPLFNGKNEKIDPTSKKPISFKVTCNKCHDYSTIEKGWHFNSGDPNVPAGRPGEPWVLLDKATGTQLPISPRGWKGTYKPQQIGMSSWTYVDTFGRHMPGGDYGEQFADKYGDPFVDRWGATGYLSINCLGCHNRDFREDGAQWAECIKKGLYLEAATAASGIGHAKGMPKSLDEMYDREMSPTAADAPQYLPVTVYDKSRFGYENSVFLNVAAARASNNRCYYCHSTHRLDKQEYQTHEDIHMARGLRCVMCHRNGIDHQISRDYEGEPGKDGAFTCRGCHLGESEAATEALRKGGSAAAPRPAHKGIPQLHLDKLTCTACHSGPLPQAEPIRVQTARIHALGNVHAGGDYDPNAPAVLEPVFVKQADGKIAPCRVVFPAFFARQDKAGKVTPMLPTAVMEATGDVLATEEGKPAVAPTKAKIIAALKALAAKKDPNSQVVYVGGGKLWKLEGAELTGTDDEAAQPYAWPIGHDVRPATQSLGADGHCTDCHSQSSAFLFGKVTAVTPAALGEPVEIQMTQLEGENATYHKLFAMTFMFRPYLKIFGFIVSGIVILILLAFGLPGLAGKLRKLSGRAVK